MKKVMLTMLAISILSACGGTDPADFDQDINNVTADVDEVDDGPVCGDGVTEPPEKCELGRSKPCFDINPVFTGYAPCLDDCSGFDELQCEG